MNRPITDKEASVVRWLIEHPGPNEPTGAWSVRAEGLRVVGGCDCGCRSIDFVPDKEGSRPVRDALGTTTDGRKNGLILWGTDCEIHSLEVYDLDPLASHELPEVCSLRTWEERGNELLNE